jgi:hypothetical protein
MMAEEVWYKEERREEYQPGGERVGRKGGGSTPGGRENEEENSAKGLTGVKAELEEMIRCFSPSLSPIMSSVSSCASIFKKSKA